MWLILELCETTVATHVVACPIICILFYAQDWQGGVLEHIKKIIV